MFSFHRHYLMHLDCRCCTQSVFEILAGKTRRLFPTTYRCSATVPRRAGSKLAPEIEHPESEPAPDVPTSSSGVLCDSLNVNSVFKPQNKRTLRTAYGPLKISGTLQVIVGPPAKLRSLPAQYANLMKVRLSTLVVITSAFGYLMAPVALDYVSFGSCVLGTFLLAGAANGFNQIFEAAYDGRMKRTKHRPVVTGQLTVNHGRAAAALTASLGFGLLYFGNNLLTASLGLSNLVLYSGLYTAMKRTSIYNTWIGSLVGAIPPLMGWAAACDSLPPGAWVLAALLYSWQFPHFHALSWNLRKDYVKGGYKMACNERPDLCASSCLRHAVGLTILCSLAAPLTGLTTWTFALDSILLNAPFTYFAWEFYRQRSSATARKLFRFSLGYLPLVLVLMWISKPVKSDTVTVAASSTENAIVGE